MISHLEWLWFLIFWTSNWFTQCTLKQPLVISKSIKWPIFNSGNEQAVCNMHNHLISLSLSGMLQGLQDKWKYFFPRMFHHLFTYNISKIAFSGFSGKIFVWVWLPHVVQLTTFQWQILGKIYETQAKVAFLKPLAQWSFLISKQAGL